MLDELAAKPAVPKYILAEQAILDAIAKGLYRPGDRLPSERALAEHFSIAPLTLRQATSRLVERGILKRRARVGTFVRAEPSAPGVDLALLVFNLPKGRPLEAAWSGFEELRGAAAREGRELHAMVMLNPLPSPTKLVDHLRQLGVGAVGMIGFLNSDQDFVEAIAEQLPCVLYNKELTGVPLPCVKPDYAEAAREMVDYLARRGRKRVGMTRIDPGHSGFNELAYALEVELHRRGMVVDPRLWFVGRDVLNEAPVHRWLGEIVEKDYRPDAIIVNGGRSARYIEEALASRGERLGREMDVIGLFDWSPDPMPDEAREYPWACMTWDLSEIARIASRMLLRIHRPGGEESEARVVLVKPKMILPKAALSG